MSRPPRERRVRSDDDARLADIVTVRDDGVIVLDLERFHGVTPTEPTEGFP